MMQDQRTPDPANDAGQIEQAILAALLVEDEQRPWSVLEVERAMGNPVAVADSLWHLHGVGLIHRCGEFVWATRAARYADQIAL